MQALILAPTRELAQQIQKVVMAGPPAPRLHRRHQRARGHAQAGRWPAHCRRHARPRLRHDLQEGPQVNIFPFTFTV